MESFPSKNVLLKKKEVPKVCAVPSLFVRWARLQAYCFHDGEREREKGFVCVCVLAR